MEQGERAKMKRSTFLIDFSRCLIVPAFRVLRVAPVRSCLHADLKISIIITDGMRRRGQKRDKEKEKEKDEGKRLTRSPRIQVACLWEVSRENSCSYAIVGYSYISCNLM